MTLTLLSLLSSAWAGDAPVVSLAITQETIDVATGMVTDLEFEIVRDNLSFEVSCWDAVGVKDLNLTIPLESVDLTMHEGYMTVRVELGNIRGERWELYTRDSNDNDGCDNISADMEWIEYRDGAIEADLILNVTDGKLDVALASTPRLEGELDMDIEWAPEWTEWLGFDWDWWPDDFFMDLFNDYLIDLIVEMAAEAVPGMLGDLAPELAFQTEVGNFAVDAELDSLHHNAQALLLDAAIDMTWTGESNCATRNVDATGGRSPDIWLPANDVAFGTTEAFVNHLGWRAWSQGLLCMDARGVDGVVRELLPDASETLSNFDVSFQLREPPVVSFDDGALGATIEGLRLDLAADYQRETVHVLDVELDLDLLVGVGIDPELASVVVGLESLDLGFDVKQTSHLLSHEDGAEQELEDFLERFVPLIIENKLTDMAVAGTTFGVMDLFYIRLDGLDLMGGALTSGVDFYSNTDPAVDTQPPETWAEIVDATDTTIIVEVDGEDDRPHPMAWKWRLDEGEWSGWTLEQSIEITVAEDGVHTLEVVARDNWWNEDATPWQQSFDRASVQIATSENWKALGCASAPAQAGWLLALMGLILAGRRRE